MTAKAPITLNIPAAGSAETVGLESYTSQTGQHFYARPGTEDVVVFEDVVDRNEYGLPPRFGPRDVVIDIGAHIGSFSYAALLRGAGRVYAFEAHPVNHAIACQNLARFGGRVDCRNRAVWRSDVRGQTLYNDILNDGIPTGGISLLWNDAGVAVETTALDDVLAEASNDFKETIRLLKLDCEGSEYPILFSSKHLGVVREICGEYHEIEPERVPGRAKVEGRPALFDRHSLKEFLEGEGWSVELEPKGKADGLFFARRKRQWGGVMKENVETGIDVEQLMAEIEAAAERSEARHGRLPDYAPHAPHDKKPHDKKAHDKKPHAAPAPARALPSAPPPSPHVAAAPQLILQADFHPSADDHYHVNDLLQYHDKAFIRNAYRALLKREPDEAGYLRQLDFLRSGRFDKIDILAGLR
ncbi:MAG: FkbM family methyltransferase, partial [Pyrinomonadaceae bacterium]